MLFVGGLHRSGTTVLAKVLAEAPGAAGLTGTGVPEDEGQHLQEVYPKARELGGPGRFALDPAAHLTEADARDAHAERTSLEKAWAPYWSRDAEIQVEKSPPNLVRMRYLQALFPDARFVVVVRHPIPVALATRKMSGAGLPRRVRHWFAAHRIVRRDLPQLSRVLVVSYESLVSGSPTPWTALERFTGLDLSRPELLRDSNRGYLEEWRAGGDLPRFQRAEEILRRRRAALRRYGYDPDDVDQHVPFPMGAPPPGR